MEKAITQVTRKREIWVDDVKVIACILVALGHFFQSMTKADILPANDLSGKIYQGEIDDKGKK